MKVGIQILSYNGERWLPGLLQSLKDSDLGDARVYLVDNASDDGSIEIACDLYPELIVLRNEGNVGYGAAYNRSIPTAFGEGCDWVCLLNQDVIVSPDWLSALKNATEDSSIGVIGPGFIEWDSEDSAAFMKARYPGAIHAIETKSDEPIDVDWVEGSVFFISRNCYESIGGFDPLFFMYWEEADFCRRARYQGYRVVLVPASICRHYAGGSTSRSNTLEHMKTKNHLVYKLLDPEHSFLRNMLSSFRLAISYFNQNRQAIGFLRLLWGTCAAAPGAYSSWKQIQARAGRHK